MTRTSPSGSRRTCTVALLLVLLALVAAHQPRPLDDRVQATAMPNDPYTKALAWPTNQLQLMHAWDLTAGSPNVTIAVLDTGVSNVPDLRGALLPGIDLVNGDGDASDDNGHGTAVAGVAAARSNNGIGIAGVCGRCSVLPVKVLDSQASGHASVVADGVRWAVAHGAKVLVISLNAPSDQPALNAALSEAIAQGVTVVTSAGNGGSANPSTGGYPAASVPDAIRVGATTAKKRLASWSNHGSWVDIAAPGWATTLRRPGGVDIGRSGTSFSAPYVAGIAGLLLSENPALTPAEVKSLILAGGTPVKGLAVVSGRFANAATSLTMAHRALAAASPVTP